MKQSEHQAQQQMQARLEALLQEGLDSGESTPMSEQDWADIRREVWARVARRKAQQNPA